MVRTKRQGENKNDGFMCEKGKKSLLRLLVHASWKNVCAFTVILESQNSWNYMTKISCIMHLSTIGLKI